MPDKLSVPEADLPGRPLLPEHIKYLEEGGISAAYLAKTPLIRSTEIELELPVYFQGHPAIEDPKGILFGWRTLDGGVEWQFRPDNPMEDPETGERKKYVFKTASTTRYGLVLKRGGPVVWIVEGTKQGHALASVVDANTTIIQIPGCAGWSRDKWTAPMDLVKLTAGKTVYVMFDADAGTNPDVYRAGEKLSARIRPTAKAVRFPPCPGDGKMGIDDALAEFPEEQRRGILDNIIKHALTKPAAERPKPKLTSIPGGKKDGDSGGDEYDEQDREWMFTPSGKLRPDTIAKHILSPDFPTPVAWSSAGLVVYNPGRGIYELNPNALTSLVQDLLGDQYTLAHQSNIEACLKGLCYKRGLILPEARTDVTDAALRDDPMICVINGALNTDTGELFPHDPKWLFSHQFPIRYDFEATGPEFIKFLRESTRVKGRGRRRHQAAILLDALSQVIDYTRYPEKGIFLFGPSRSGKGTTIELIRKIIGPGGYAAMSFHELESNRFATADLYLKRANMDADSSSEHISSPPIFKKMLGRDPISGDQKNGRRFTFINTAVPIFGANHLPTVGEKSRAVITRSVPVHFPYPKEGRAGDKELPERLAAELPGIFNLLLAALQARRARRGQFLEPDPSVMADFEKKVSPVYAFVDEACWIWPKGGEGWSGSKTIKTDYGLGLRRLYKLYEAWCGETGHRGVVSQQNLKEVLLAMPGVYLNEDQGRNEVFNLTPAWDAGWGPLPESLSLVRWPRQPPALNDGDDDDTDSGTDDDFPEYARVFDFPNDESAEDADDGEDPDPAPKPTGRFTPQQGRG